MLANGFISTHEETEAQTDVLPESHTKRQEQRQDLNSDSGRPQKTVYFFNPDCLIIKHLALGSLCFCQGLGQDRNIRKGRGEIVTSHPFLKMKKKRSQC